jgi:hypothetical protein
MEFTNATRQVSSLEDGSHKIEVHAQWNNLFFRSILVFVPHMLNLSTFSMFISKYVALKTKIITGVPSSISFMPNPSAPPYYNVTSTTTPHHRLVLDFSTLKVSDILEPPLQSFGPEPSQSIDSFRTLYKILYSKFVFKYFSSLTLQQGEHISFYLQTDFYDLRATQFSKSKCGRVWRLERTMTRVMTRELEQLIGGVIPRYKGVRWRPERKHPWIAEIKVSRHAKTKMWLGNYDTPEEAARAYDATAIQFGKQTMLNFEDSCKHISNSTMRSTMASDQNCTIGSSFEISTSQSMPLGSHTSLGEASVQARAMPTCALVNHDCKMNPHVTQVDIQPNSTNIMTLEKYSTLKVLDQELGEVNTNNKTLTVLENDNKSYFMFASDLPSMIDTSDVLERTGSSSKHGVYDMHSHELFFFEYGRNERC